MHPAFAPPSLRRGVSPSASRLHLLLPPTPPDDDSHFVWNPSNQALLCQKRMNSVSRMPWNDALSMAGSSSTNISCVSDRSSTGTSSASGSPVGPADNRWSVRTPVEPWLEKCIEAAGEFQLLPSFVW